MDDEIFYTDKRGGRDHECLSLGCDHEPVLAGRTPLQTYADFVGEFAEQCSKNDLWGAHPCLSAVLPVAFSQPPLHSETYPSRGLPALDAQRLLMSIVLQDTKM